MSRQFRSSISPVTFQAQTGSQPRSGSTRRGEGSTVPETPSQGTVPGTPLQPDFLQPAAKSPPAISQLRRSPGDPADRLQPIPSVLREPAASVIDGNWYSASGQGLPERTQQAPSGLGGDMSRGTQGAFKYPEEIGTEREERPLVISTRQPAQQPEQQEQPGALAGEA